MRQLALAVLTTLALAACSGGTDAPAAPDLSTLPATVEGEIYFDLAEASDSGSIGPSETTLVGLTIPGKELDGDDDGDGETSIDVVLTGKQIADLGVDGNGERVRATLSGRTTWGGMQAYEASSVQKL